MKILKENRTIYDDLKSLLRLSIAGILIVAGLNYIFNGLIAQLEDKTKKTQLQAEILKNIKSNTINARYNFSKLTSFSDKQYEQYKTYTLKYITESDLGIKVLKFGGEIEVGFYRKNRFYEATNSKVLIPIMAEEELESSIKNSILKLDELMLKRRDYLENSDISVVAIQMQMSQEIDSKSKLLNDRLENIDRALRNTRSKLTQIENDIKYKKELYFYTQMLTYILIVLSLIFVSKPIREHIVKTNDELENKTNEAKKMAIRAKQANKSKSEFLANMSHEIRTPLNAIMGFIDLLKEKESDSEKLQYMKTIQNSSIALLGIINDILDFSKIESGNLAIDKVDFNVEDEFKTLVELFMAKASEKSINLELIMDPNMPSALHSDPLRIKQVIANLISNAIKFTPRNGKVVLNIRYTNGKLAVSVSDNGIGIPKDKQKHIFKAFSQAETSTTRKYGGTGLGLTISSRLISLLGGVLKLESVEGEGSTFSFEIDVKIGKHKKASNISAINLDLFRGKKILLVEDNKANQMFMSLILKKLGLSYEIANDGLEAIKAFEDGKFDLILMDENMPNLNGIEATKYILEYEEKNSLKHTPIVALTANALKGDREKFLEAGMDEYLTKPISKDRLAEVFEQFLVNNKESVC
jgi:signal transduction histidine kinase/ActR/RegA family two-component response regulator